MNRGTWDTSRDGVALLRELDEACRASMPTGEHVAIEMMIQVECAERALAYISPEHRQLAERAVKVTRRMPVENETRTILLEARTEYFNHRGTLAGDALFVCLQVPHLAASMHGYWPFEPGVLIPPTSPTWDDDNAFLADVVRRAAAAHNLTPWKD